MDPLKDITGERVQTSMSLEGFEPAILMRYDLHIEYYLLVTVWSDYQVPSKFRLSTYVS
jgi:hypothetical protein